MLQDDGLTIKMPTLFIKKKKKKSKNTVFFSPVIFNIFIDT